jgi:2,4-dienoyl-CoA reductase-like NADH-dependent reductase (Old Yellow Enzyme family)
MLIARPVANPTELRHRHRLVREASMWLQRPALRIRTLTLGTRHPTMATATLFTPFTVGNITLANRIVIAPMCQYSAVDGRMTDWHLIHLGHLALSSAALLTIEATAVVPEGRITYRDVGLWSDETEEAIGRTLESIRRWSSMPIAIQLAHAGRKASSEVPWKGGGHLAPDHANGWQTVSASAVPYNTGWHAPTPLDADGLVRMRDAFADAARRAARLGIDAVQLHGAHGYLLHQFLSPLSNHRDDEYGGSLENRMRFPLEVFDAVRAAFPAERPVTIRISGTDWAEGGWDIEQSIAFARALEARGCSAVHVSSGGLTPNQRIPLGPGYQVPLARAVKQATSLPVIAVGLITDFEQAEAIVSAGDADIIALARAMLYDPRWPWHAAAHFGARVRVPDQYLRSQPREYPDLFETGE